MTKPKDNNDDDFIEEPAVENDESSNGADESVVAEEHSVETIKKLRDKIKALESEKQEFLTGWQRAKADLINARKQDEKDKIDFAIYANEKLIAELLPALESFEMATFDKEKWQAVDKTWREGVERIFAQLKTVLQKHGVTEIDPMGEQYDHNLHQAVNLVDTEEKKEDNRIIGVISKGYNLNSKLLKAPKVRVAQHKETK